MTKNKRKSSSQTLSTHINESSKVGRPEKALTSYIAEIFSFVESKKKIYL